MQYICMCAILIAWQVRLLGMYMEMFVCCPPSVIYATSMVVYRAKIRDIDVVHSIGVA